jgi:hypothetical protein
MSDANQSDSPTASRSERALPAFASLKPKGACWYCNQPLDNVRRFCSKVCADDYRIEEESFDRPSV